MQEHTNNFGENASKKYVFLSSQNIKIDWLVYFVITD